MYINYNIFNNMDKSHSPFVEWKKSDIKEYIFYDPIYTKFKWN